MNEKLSHLDQSGNPKMVDVSGKSESNREAIARATIVFPEDVAAILQEQKLQSKKGSITHTAIIAGNMAVKKTAELIPLCHPLPINGCDIKIAGIKDGKMDITCMVKTTGKTGVEMEALTGKYDYHG